MFDTGDDSPNYIDQPLLSPVKSGEWIPRITKIFQADSIIGVWEPLSLLVKCMLVQMFGMQARTFSGASACLHATCCILAAEVAFRGNRLLGNRIERLHACCAALLLGIHPLRVEPLAWASGFPYTISTLFALVAVIFHIRHMEATKTSASNQVVHVARPICLWRLLSAACLVLSANAKAAALGLVAVLPLLDLLLIWELPRATGAVSKCRWWTRSLLIMLIDHLPTILAAAPAAIPAFRASKGPDAQCRFDFVGSQRVLRACYMAILYMVQQVWPHDLCVMHAVPVEDIHVATVKFGGSALLLVLLLLVALSKGARWVATSLAYLAILAPTLGILTDHIAETAADRYSHITCMVLGVPVLAGFMWSVKPKIGRLSLSVLVFIAGVEAGVTRSYVRLWHNEELTIAQAVRASPRFYRTRYIHGISLMQHGDSKGAEVEFRASLALCPNFTNTHFGLTQALMQLGRMDESIQAMRVGTEHAPDNPLGYSNLGQLLQMQHRHAEAVVALQRAIELEPRDRDNHKALHQSRQALAQGVGSRRQPRR